MPECSCTLSFFIQVGKLAADSAHFLFLYSLGKSVADPVMLIRLQMQQKDWIDAKWTRLLFYFCR